MAVIVGGPVQVESDVRKAVILGEWFYNESFGW